MDSLDKYLEKPTVGSGKAEHKHFSIDDDICPDCYPTVKAKVLEKEILSRKDNPLECVNCGTRVKESEDECPTCRGKDARRRE